MRTSFFGLETGLRALQANQMALDVTGHNISNANAAGYSRQTIRMEATTPYAMPTMSKTSGPGMIGTGVQVTDIRAVRDFFLDAQVRNETSNIGFWETRQDILQEVEVIFNEPQGSGLRTVIDQFWSAWQNVAANPSEEQYRQVLIQSGQELSDTFRTVYGQLSSLQSNLRDTVGSKVNEANSLFQQIADLNQQISRVTGVGDNPNDLMDTRNRLTEQLSRLVDIDAQVDSSGIMNIFVGGHEAVSGFTADKLVAGAGTKIVGVPSGHITPSDFVPQEVYWQKTSSGATRDQLVSDHGELVANVDAINNGIHGYLDDVEEMAQEIVYHVNDLHEDGFSLTPPPGANTNLDFFRPWNGPSACAATMEVIVTDPSQVAAAGSAAELPGKGSKASEIADFLEDAPMMGGASLDDFFSGMIGGLGVQSQETERMTENQNLLLTQIQNQRQSATGVNNDEEMLNLIKFQQGYNAAARLVTTVDEMIDTIINRMGLVGR